MPIYEYVCKDCGSHFDTIRTMKEADSPIICMDCHGDNTVRKLSLFVSRSGQRSEPVTSSGCGGCSGGSCSTCHH